jgi:hypothetical protein
MLDLSAGSVFLNLTAGFDVVANSLVILKLGFHYSEEQCSGDHKPVKAQTGKI